jgi:phospholipid/cholesterol/gamma-HCH transport system permease protein
MDATAGWLQQEVEDGVTVLYLKGAWRLANLAPISAALESAKAGARKSCVLDGSRLQELDTAAGFTLYHHLAGSGCTDATVSVRGFEPRHERILELVRTRMECPPAAMRSVHRGLASRVGNSMVYMWGLLKSHNAFVGSVSLQLLRLARRPVLFRTKETVSQFETICLDAIPIVCLVTFLIGVVFTYLLGVQALRYGANIFVVDGVGLAMCRELSPILVSLIVAGRSGAAFTAQIGAMKVQEEVDAISTLGLSPIQVLVIPRLVAITLALPLLVFVGDLAGIAGGMVVGAVQLGISPETFLDRIHAVLPMSALVVGLGKAPVFAVFIAMIACRMGLLAARDARSVGVNTTSTVVQSIVWVIVLDAIFAVVLQHLDI